MPLPPIGSVLTLECQGDADGPRFLDGRTMDGTVGLATHTTPSGTQWALTMHAGDVVTLKCMGDITGPRFLDGRTIDGTVGLAPDANSDRSGTRWAISETSDGKVMLRCLGLADGNRFLDGRTAIGTVGLAPNTDSPFSGTQWRLHVTGKLVMIFCLGNDKEGARFLNGITRNRRVKLVDTTHFPNSGTRWHMIGDENYFILKCVGDGFGPGDGEGDGPWYLDGNTATGYVGLAPRTTAPFTGTAWKKEGDLLKCLGAHEGLRYLSGRIADSAVELVGSPDIAPKETRWRILEPCLPSATHHATDARGPVTVRVAQLTGWNKSHGSIDAENRPILNETYDWGAGGQDLGANCEYTTGPDHPYSRLYIFLSDVITSGNAPKVNTDLVAWMDAPALGGHEAAGFNFTLPAEPMSAHGESGWSNCRHCSALFFNGGDDKGVCPADDDGHAAGDQKLIIPFEPTGISGQREWRKCLKCLSMFFELYADRGVCPAGGRHKAGTFHRYVLPHEDRKDPHQPGWRFCQWCRAAFFDDHDRRGACIAGGTAFRLNAVRDEHYFDPFTVDGEIGPTLQAETPTGAFSYDQRIYVFIWMAGRDQKHPPGSYLVSKDDPGISGPYEEEIPFSDDDASFSNLYTVTKGFWQVAPWVIKNADIPGLPETAGEDGLLMFGQGRESFERIGDDSREQDAIHLAWMPLRSPREAEQLGGRSGPQKHADIRYRADNESGWSTERNDATALFTMPAHYTSVSVAWLEGPQRWIILYSNACGDQNLRRYEPTGSVVARLGTTPWTWSDEIEIFNPCREGAYGCYMHWHGLDSIYPQVLPAAPLDDQPGSAYGAFLLNRFTKWHPGTRMLDIYYLLSLARPYQPQIMFTKMYVPEE